MPSGNPASPEVFTVEEIARAAGASVEDARALMATSGIAAFDGRFATLDDAARLVVLLQRGAGAERRSPALFATSPAQVRSGRMPYAASGALHAGILTTLVLLAGLGVRTQPAEQKMIEPARLVFLTTPGPGGGGGGGGLRNPLPPPRAEIRGASKLKSPVTVTRKAERVEPPKRVETPPPPAPEPVPEPLPPPPPQPAPTPPVVAPVVTAPSDDADRVGVLAGAPDTRSNGPGAGGGAGTGSGTGIGEGSGSGIGEGSGGGIGGGPYRPGSGVTPPSLVREVKPIYSEEGRRRGIEGDVVMEVVVRADGSVGAVRVIHGLGSGLDQRAVDAVRQWRFSPSRRLGSPVDVLVEVAVEFRLR